MAGQYAVYQSARHTLDEPGESNTRPILNLIITDSCLMNWIRWRLKDNEAEELEAESRLSKMLMLSGAALQVPTIYIERIRTAPGSTDQNHR